MLRDDPEYFVETFRMTPEAFDHLLSLIGPKLLKVGSLRESISPRERLQMTVVYVLYYIFTVYLLYNIFLFLIIELIYVAGI